MTQVTVAAIQTAFGKNIDQNIQVTLDQISLAAKAGAQIILPSELFESPYFCKEQNEDFFSLARPVENHPTLEKMQALAQKLKVVLPVSFFEKASQTYYNSIAIIDADGRIMGTYRKSHIPDGPGYQEKFYFRPGDTGFKVWKTRYAAIGVGICWDQWFPECARSMVLQGADLLFYPTAIGSEPANPQLHTKDRWQRAMIGHAVSNVVPVIASNRTGDEDGQHFYGHSFICDPGGDKISELADGKIGFILAKFDLEEIRTSRSSWGFFRDRRPELYRTLSTADGFNLF